MGKAVPMTSKTPIARRIRRGPGGESCCPKLFGHRRLTRSAVERAVGPTKVRFSRMTPDREKGFPSMRTANSTVSEVPHADRMRSSNPSGTRKMTLDAVDFRMSLFTAAIWDLRATFAPRPGCEDLVTRREARGQAIAVMNFWFKKPIRTIQELLPIFRQSTDKGQPEAGMPVAAPRDAT